MTAGAAATSVAVMADAQLTNAKVLRPFPGFERVYQGQSAEIPIAFPGFLDPRASDAVNDPKLLVGIPVPQGARLLLLLPTCFAPTTEGEPEQTLYSYRLVWRFQNLDGYQTPQPKVRRAPFHFPHGNLGAPGTSGTPVRVLPAAWHNVAYQQAEPAEGPGDLHLREEILTPILDLDSEFTPPLLPSGDAAAIQQGILAPSLTAGNSRMPMYQPFWTTAAADELIVLVKRTVIAEDAPNWDFTGVDLPFSNLFGTGNGTHEPYKTVGLYLQTGTTP